MAKIEEPWVRVTERVRETPNLLNIDGTANIGGVVVSPMGKRYQYISGPRDFLDKLVGADDLPRDSHVSLINAYYCSFFAGLVIARSMNTDAVATGIIDSGIYNSDGEEERAPGIVTPSPNMLNDSILNYAVDLCWTDYNYDYWAFIMNNVCFYKAPPSIYNSEIAPYLPFAKDATPVYVNDIDDIINTISNWSGFNCEEISEPSDWSPLYPVNNDQQPKEKKQVSLENLFNNPNLKVKFIRLKYNAIDEAQGDLSIDIKPQWYHRSEIDPEFNPARHIVYMNTTGDDNINPNKTDSCVQLANSEFTKVGDSYLIINRTQPSTNSENEIITIKFNLLENQGLNGNLFLMTVSYQTHNSYFYVSLNPNVLTSDGQNAFIENLNTTYDLLNFQVIDGGNLSKVETALNGAEFTLGSSGLTTSASATSANFRKGLNDLAEQKEYAIEYLSDFGYTDSAFIHNYTDIGRDNYWFTPVDIPESDSNIATMLQFSNDVMDDNNILVCGPFDKNTSFLSFPCKIAASSLYYERIFNNRNNSSEWAPAFEQTNGVLNYHNPMYRLGATDRKTLLNGWNGPAVFAVYNQTENIYYFNDNRCHTTTKNVMSEEMNRRMINKIKKDIIQLVNRFKGRTNTASTRADVEALIKVYFDTNIMNQYYCPEDFIVRCDETNNTAEIITANKLAIYVGVRLYHSIKYIDVLLDIFPLGIEFEV